MIQAKRAYDEVEKTDARTAGKTRPARRGGVAGGRAVRRGARLRSGARPRVRTVRPSGSGRGPMGRRTQRDPGLPELPRGGRAGRAGGVLIVNIFTMLAEERKVELGMGRAMGMRRSTLVQLFVFEGLTYAVAAAARRGRLGR